ncbi:MAG: recombinase family protein [Clostridia bacterium]|nr:recombinase family protein [Clostridia bacterium]
MKTAIYVRSALNDNGISCEAQIKSCKKSLKPNDEYVIYSDNGYSANDKEKPAFNEMLSAIKNGEIDTVIVYNLDRICRDISSFCIFMNTLQKHNVTFTNAVDGFSSSSPYGQAILKYLLVFAEMERVNHSERCRQGWARRKQKKEAS